MENNQEETILMLDTGLSANETEQKLAEIRKVPAGKFDIRAYLKLLQFKEQDDPTEANLLGYDYHFHRSIGIEEMGDSINTQIIASLVCSRWKYEALIEMSLEAGQIKWMVDFSATTVPPGKQPNMGGAAIQVSQVEFQGSHTQEQVLERLSHVLMFLDQGLRQATLQMLPLVTEPPEEI